MEQLGLIGGFLPLIIVLVLMYFMMIRPQQKQQKKLANMRSALSVGDEIVTIGGIKGTVVMVSEDTVTVKSGNGAQLDFVKTAVGQVVEKESAAVDNTQE